MNTRKEINEKEAYIRNQEATEFAYEAKERLPLLEIMPCGYCGSFNAKRKSLLKELKGIKPDKEAEKPICQDCYFTAPIKKNIRQIKILDEKLSTLSPYHV
jgi:hypothetical protein